MGISHAVRHTRDSRKKIPKKNRDQHARAKSRQRHVLDTGKQFIDNFIIFQYPNGMPATENPFIDRFIDE